MRTIRALPLLAVLMVAACGGSEASVDLESDGTDPASGPVGAGGGAGTSGGPTTDEGAMVVDLRADTNRDGQITFDSSADDDGEDDWNAQHGAVFLANIDDDEKRCPTTGGDVALAKCNDGADDEVNGADDAADLARLRTKAWAKAPADASGRVAFTAGDHVRLFKVKGSAFELLETDAPLSADEIREGVELAIEGRDIVRDPAAWDGFADVSLTITAAGETKTDKVRMRVAPLLTYHHLSPAEEIWSSANSSGGNQAMRADVNEALATAGLPPLRTVNTSDPWNQDYFETGFMSMPAPDGKQHVIRVLIRSANTTFTTGASNNPLRTAGRFIFLARGKDVAAVQEYDPARGQKFDTLNSFGNFETIPPYSHNGQTFPLGRVLRGSTATYYPDKFFQRMIEAQKIQPTVTIDTSWLLVGHVDETISFVKANTPRGWVMLVNDAALAKKMLEEASAAGNGSVPQFVEKYWGQSSPAQITIDQTLSNTDVMGASAEAVVEVAAQVDKLKEELGLTDAEIVKVPFLHETTSGRSIAFQPGTVNGIYITDGRFVAPNPHGPVIEGKDIMKTAMEQALAPHGITVHWAEDWDGYHRNLGEVHCGTNATRQVPTAKWWESGR